MNDKLIRVSPGISRIGSIVIVDRSWERHEDGRWMVGWEVPTFGGIFHERRSRYFRLKGEAVAFARELNEAVNR